MDSAPMPSASASSIAASTIARTVRPDRPGRSCAPQSSARLCAGSTPADSPDDFLALTGTFSDLASLRSNRTLYGTSYEISGEDGYATDDRRRDGGRHGLGDRCPGYAQALPG